MNLNKNFLTEVIKYLISRGVTLTDVLDTFNENFNTLDAFNDSLKNMPTEIKRGTINNVIEDPLLPKYTMTESDKVRLESVSLSPETLNKVFDFSKEKKQNEVRKPITDIDLLFCGKSVEESSTPGQKVDSNRDLCQKVEEKAENTEKPVNKSWIDYPKNNKNHGNGVSPARKALFDVVGDKTVIEHLRANGIDYKVYDNRVRKKWSIEEACTTPLASWGKGKRKRKRVIEEPGEPKEAKAVIIPDNPDTIICLEPEKITGTKTVTHAENTAENITVEPQTKTNTDARVNDANANSDAIHRDKDNIEKALKKFITSTTGIKYDESKKDKKPKETKSDLTVLEVCQKMNVTTHELRKMINTGDFPQPDCDKKWSVKLLKKEGII